MNIDVNQNLKTSTVNSSSTSSTKTNKEDEGKFAEELKTLSAKETKETSKEETKKTEDTKEVSKKDETKKAEKSDNIDEVKKTEDKGTEECITGLKNTVQEIQKLNRTVEKDNKPVQENNTFADKQNERAEEILLNEEQNKNFFVKKSTKFDKKEFEKTQIKNEKEDETLIDNNMNVQDTKDKPLPQMNPNMNFNSDGQPFAEFVNPKKENVKLKVTAEELAEEQKILSTMDENVAIANKNMIKQSKSAEKNVEQKVVEKVANNILQDIIEDETEDIKTIEPKTKTVTTDEGVKKVDKKSNVTVETVVKYDTVVMDKSDVDFFSKLVNEGAVDMREVQNAQKSSQVSKTLADLIAKSMNENKPVRIDFDNDISVIIKVGKDGKISADFLPSSQVAEAYLKENLPLLKQRFDDNNIEYDELNQRNRQQKDNQENRKKGRKDE